MHVQLKSGYISQLYFNMQKNYSITSNYIIRTTKIPHDDRDFKDEYQNEVYLHATKLCQDYKYTTVTDIGCGSGYKLNKYFSQYDTVGYEIEPCYSYLRSKYPNKKWELSEFKNKLIDSDLIICADVIEHLTDPDLLIDWIYTSNFKHIIFSTPDRDMLYEKQQCGPPYNTDHVREWTFFEFQKYLENKFKIIEHFHCIECNTCQVCVCSPLL